MSGTGYSIPDDVVWYKEFWPGEFTCRVWQDSLKEGWMAPPDTYTYPGDGNASTEGQLWFNKFNVGGFVGDVMTANLLYKPFLDVRARRDRVRILNGDGCRFMKLSSVVKREDGRGEYPGEAGATSYDRFPATLIATDGT